MHPDLPHKRWTSEYRETAGVILTMYQNNQRNTMKIPHIRSSDPQISKVQERISLNTM